MRIRDPGWKKVGSGINIPDPQHCSLPTPFLLLLVFSGKYLGSASEIESPLWLRILPDLGLVRYCPQCPAMLLQGAVVQILDLCNESV